MIVADDFKISCECLFEMTKLLFAPISTRALKHNEKNDTSKNPRPNIVGHTWFFSPISDIFWRLEKQNERFETKLEKINASHRDNGRNFHGQVSFLRLPARDLACREIF
jgi:hypothetical protein